MRNVIRLMVAVVLVGAVKVSAQDLSRGRNELGLAGIIRLDEPAPLDYMVFMDAKYGRFVRDKLQVGAIATVFATDVSWTLTVGPLVEYNFDLGNRWPRLTPWVPFVGASVALATAEIDEDWAVDVERAETRAESSSGVAITGETGIKRFLSDSVALTASFNFSWSSDDVFNGESDAQNILLGIRAYF